MSRTSRLTLATLVLVAAAAVGRHEGEMVARGWPGGAILVILFPVMFPAPGRAALAFGLAGWAADIAVAFHYGRTPADFGGWVGLYHGYLMGTIFSVALAYLQRRIGQTEITSSNLGSYNLVEKLGEGGMGEVWRADHTLLKRGAAVKLIHPKRARDPKSAVAYRKRFEREVQSASRLRSPYTVEIFDYGEREDGVLWFAMELIDGLDMVELTFRNRPLHIERIVHLLSQVCHSLEEAHEHGLVHRDIKPNNVMVGRMGAEYDFVKVLDFGLVKLEETKEDVKLTRAGATPGTPGFMAPEQIMTRRSHCSRSVPSRARNAVYSESTPKRVERRRISCASSRYLGSLKTDSPTRAGRPSPAPAAPATINHWRQRQRTGDEAVYHESDTVSFRKSQPIFALRPPARRALPQSSSGS